MIEFYKKLQELYSKEIPFVAVTLVDSIGSTPQDQGAKMLVSPEGLYYGTVGGGKVETKAIQEATLMLSEKPRRFQFHQWNLNKDVGMTCGGTVRLYFELFRHNEWNITIFGAGHVSNALIKILLSLDCQISCIDPREEWLNKLPESEKLKKIKTADMPSEVKNIRDKSFVILMTMGHSTDKPILLEILKSREFPYLGVIGSKAKANILKRDILEAGLPETYRDKFYCPLGLDIGSNAPAEIAISIVAQLLQERDKISETGN